jgi:hypothetical protein
VNCDEQNSSVLFCSGGAKEEEEEAGRRDCEEMEVMMGAMGREMSKLKE